MNRKKYNQFRVVISVFVATVVAIAVVQESYALSLVGVITGMIFMALVRTKTHFKIDEREQLIGEKAALLAYKIFAPTIGIGAFILILPYQKLSPVFSGGNFTYLESLGLVLAYLTLFLIALYAISYHFLNHKYGGGSHEK